MSVKLERFARAGCSPGRCAPWLGLVGMAALGWMGRRRLEMQRCCGCRAGQWQDVAFRSHKLRGEGAWSSLQAPVSSSRGSQGLTGEWGCPGWAWGFWPQPKPCWRTFWSSDAGDSAPRGTLSWCRNLWNEFKGRGLVTPLLERRLGGRAFKVIHCLVYALKKSAAESSLRGWYYDYCSCLAAQAMFHSVLASCLNVSKPPLCSICFCKSIMGRKLLD